MVNTSYIDALSGLRELLSENATLIEPSLTSLINRCVTLISDEVRILQKILACGLIYL